MRLTVHGIVAVVAVVALSGMASAQVLTPVAATPSSTFETYDAVDLINDSGLSGGLHDVEYTNMWMSDRGDVQAVVTFDLGASYELNAALIWQYNATCCGLERGVRNFDISVSADNVTFTPAGSGSLTESPGGAIPAQTVWFSGAGRYVRFSVASNWGDSQFTGLSEVKFLSGEFPEPVPALSPAAAGGLALLLALAALALLRRLA